MEYVYAAMILHEAKKEINEANLKNVLKAAGVTVDEARIKALVSSLEGVDIEEAISSASMPVAQAPAAAPAASASDHKASGESKKEEKKEETDESALEGLGALFG
ncbi:MAG: 50S ribosomal protein L12 [Candidatus Methanofastidiosum methylothiophilum]|uniref:Large ribosomal subunit protein P1 n=1 Tax=Candidatus Methanofastidiosum methylothiophilum TaxID=1705564 RepID=A0A150IJB8_9EURY|nr:MAG: 50S ribosomal protein L12 [Candidatus Methanofastidiosum methylthiophilus]KYC48663.1 MAG: 50S ribosomal protein L12 [Candidatus Methanofastidiosum methylthiophilus]KYC51132.1 MAG: 50S ribosomal protein L12 [Candidatus Methanofastidiosum methylthiophilus]